jgi:hypothetical protein
VTALAFSRGLGVSVCLTMAVGATVLAGCAGGAAEPAPASGNAAPHTSVGGESSDSNTVGTAARSESAAANQQGRPPPLVAPPPPQEHAALPVPGTGGDREHPVPTCGPLESYVYVARDFQCPGGGNPFGGDPAAAQAARRGSVGAHAYSGPRTGDFVMDAHIVDVYDVPCASGRTPVYVCMYHCASEPLAGPGRSPR